MDQRAQDSNFAQGRFGGPGGTGNASNPTRGDDNNNNENQPNRFESFLREPGEKCVRMVPETRVPNAAMFYFTKEDHTLGGMLTRQLKEYPYVLFHGYKVPHPLNAEFELRVQTDGTVTPKQAVVKACADLVRTCGDVSSKFQSEFELKRVTDEGMGGAGAGGY